jgi:hypothetical protein
MDRLLEPNNEQTMHCNWEQPKEDKEYAKTLRAWLSNWVSNHES